MTETAENNYTKKTNKLVLFSILRHSLSKFVTQTGLYRSKQLETTSSQFGKNRCISPLKCDSYLNFCKGGFDARTFARHEMIG